MLTSNRLFVYGTLRPPFDNRAARLLHQSASHLGLGRTRGKLYRVAYYPGLIACPDPEDSWVQGDVYHLHHPEETYAALDAYEGEEYRRTVLPVELETGGWIEACLYVYLREVSRLQLIESDDYLVR